MLESAVKRKIVKAVIAEGGYARRMEDKYLVGQPDLLMVFPGSPVFIAEVKVFLHLSFEPTPRQFEELKKMAISYSIEPIMVGYKDSKYYISGPRETVSVTDCVFTMKEETFPQTLKRWYNGKIAQSKANRASSPNIGGEGQEPRTPV